MKTTKYFLFALFVLALASCSKKNLKYDASGVFETTEVMVSSEVNGKIMQLDLQEGQVVEAAAVVGYIDSTQLFFQKKQLEAKLKATNSRYTDVSTQIAATQQQIETARREQKRFQNLVKLNAANQKQVDDITAQIAVLEKQLAAQKTMLESGNAGITDEGAATGWQIRQLDDQLKKCVIKAPMSGTVLAKYAEPGELAVPGKVLFKLADLQTMYLRAYITASQLTSIKIGQAVKVYADMGESGNKEYAGTVTWISDKAEFTPKTIQTRDERANLVYAVKISVKNDGYIKKGMYGELKMSF